jgi:hypothetical protein
LLACQGVVVHANGRMEKTRTHDSSRRNFLRGSAFVATSLCFTSPLARAANFFHADPTVDSTVSVLGAAYADLAANYRWQQHQLSYTTREVRSSFDQHVLTQIKLTHRGGLGLSNAESSDAVRNEIQALARGVHLDGEDMADEANDFEPTVVLYQGRAYADEAVLKAVRPLCAAMLREQRKISGDAPVRGITLSSKGSESFRPWVLIA